MARIGRLRRRSEFLAVAASGKKWAAAGLVLQARPCVSGQRHANGDAALWVGITVSRRVGSAVARNRARRRLRAATSEVMPRMAATGYDYVVIGREATLTRPYSALLSDLEVALRRVGASRAVPADSTAEPASRERP